MGIEPTRDGSNAPHRIWSPVALTGWGLCTVRFQPCVILRSTYGQLSITFFLFLFLVSYSTLIVEIYLLNESLNVKKDSNCIFIDWVSRKKQWVKVFLKVLPFLHKKYYIFYITPFMASLLNAVHIMI